MNWSALCLSYVFTQALFIRLNIKSIAATRSQSGFNENALQAAACIYVEWFTTSNPLFWLIMLDFASLLNF